MIRCSSGAMRTVPAGTTLRVRHRDRVRDRERLQIVCTVHSSIEETRNEVRFPARSYVLYTAPRVRTSRVPIPRRTVHRIFAHLDDYEHYRMNDEQHGRLDGGSAEHWVYIRSDGQHDYGMWWRYYGQLEVATADIDYSTSSTRAHTCPPVSADSTAHGPFDSESPLQLSEDSPDTSPVLGAVALRLAHARG